jgi:hypothetical protein
LILVVTDAGCGLMGASPSRPRQEMGDRMGNRCHHDCEQAPEFVGGQRDQTVLGAMGAAIAVRGHHQEIEHVVGAPEAHPSHTDQGRRI